jgi:hypothetical protein
MTTNSCNYLKEVLRHAELNEDVYLPGLFDEELLFHVGVPDRLGIDEFPLVRQQMLFLLELEEDTFDSLFGPKLHQTHTIKNIKALLDDSRRRSNP